MWGSSTEICRTSGVVSRAHLQLREEVVGRLQDGSSCQGIVHRHGLSGEETDSGTASADYELNTIKAM